MTTIEESQLIAWEEMRLKAYWPTRESGITISAGVDFRFWSPEDLQKLGVPKKLAERFRSYYRLKGQEAKKHLDQNKPIAISLSDAKILYKAVLRDITQSIERQYNRDSRKKRSFALLPLTQRTVIVSVAYHYGADLPKDCPDFWKYVLQENWKKTYQELMNFRDQDPKRRKKEATYLKKWMDKESRETQAAGEHYTTENGMVYFWTKDGRVDDYTVQELMFGLGAEMAEMGESLSKEEAIAHEEGRLTCGTNRIIYSNR